MSDATPRDPGLDDVAEWVRTFPLRANVGLTLEQLFSRAIRKAIDEVIDGARTGRFSYAELETQERTYIGTRIEIVFRTELGLDRVRPLDTVIEGHPVDFKWSTKGEWMIPNEARGHICLLLSGDEAGGQFSVGLVRCRPELLRPGSNQDGKVQLSAAGRRHISWLVRDGTLPLSFLATLRPDVRSRILAAKPGQARVREFFRLVTGRPVPREVIPTLAIQEDPMRRIRQDRSRDSLGGMKVLSGHYSVSREAAELLGCGPLSKRDYLSVPVEQLLGLPDEVRRRLRL